MDNPKISSLGLEIFIETGLDVSGATEIQMRYTKPDASKGFFVATGKIIGDRVGCSYITTFVTDIDQIGDWIFQIYATGTGYELYGDEVTQAFSAPMSGPFV